MLKWLFLHIFLFKSYWQGKAVKVIFQEDIEWRALHNVVCNVRQTYN